jgi:hypothetical protein
MSLTRLAYALALVTTVGCGQQLTPYQSGNGGPKRDLSFVLPDGGPAVADLAGADLGGVVAIVDMAGFNTPGSPLVVIDTPTPTTEVQYDTLTVTATVTSPSSTVINAGAVTLTVTPPGGGVMTVPMTLTPKPNIYSGAIDISLVPSGNASFTVSAVDVLGRKGSATGGYIHDHGPTITFLQPAAPTAHGTVVVELLVDDPLHPVTDPTAVIAGIRAPSDITLVQEAGAVPMRLAATVDLVNGYNPSLDGLQLITAQATNPKGTVTHATKEFTVDNVGPVISFTNKGDNPGPGQIIGGVIEVVVDITDVSGVNDSSVIAIFGNDPTKNTLALTRVTAGSNQFHGFFDVRTLGTNYVLPELSVRASDNVGNDSQLGEVITVDNVPPRMTMDASLTMRVSKSVTTNGSTQMECSQTFSPLGPLTEAAGEGSTVLQLIGLRARIEDHGNTAPGLLKEIMSGVDNTTVQLFVVPDRLNDPNSVLVVDTNGDNTCDDVNPLLIPGPVALAPGQALSLALAPFTDTGAPDWTVDTNGTKVAGVCDFFGESGAAPPAPLCTRAGTNMTFVIPYVDVDPPIYSIPPFGDPGNCVGQQLDAANVLPEGPACAVVRAVDKVGNVNVTAPLHICIDLGSLPSKCAGFTPVAAHCTGKFDKTQQKLVAGTCTPRASFASGEVRDLDKFK